MPKKDALLGVAISLSAVLISATQVGVAYYQKEKEIEIASSQKTKEFELQKKIKDDELKLNAIKFVTEHKELVFSSNEIELKKMQQIMIATFPKEICDALFQRIERASDENSTKVLWEIKDITPRVKEKVIPGGTSDTVLHKFTIYLDLPKGERGTINDVVYTFDHPSFKNKYIRATEENNGFGVSYSGWGALDDVGIKITFKDGRQKNMSFDMMKALGW